MSDPPPERLFDDDILALKFAAHPQLARSAKNQR